MQKELIKLLEIADILEEEGYSTLPDDIRDIVEKMNSIAKKNDNKDTLDGIIKFQKDRLLDKQPFEFETEILHILEELVEMLGYESLYARERAKTIFQHFKNHEPIEREKLVDCFADIIVFAVGSIMKLGYDPKCVLNEVSKEINSRTGSIINGKFVKDKSPEAKAKWYKANYDKCLKG